MGLVDHQNLPPVNDHKKRIINKVAHGVLERGIRHPLPVPITPSSRHSSPMAVKSPNPCFTASLRTRPIRPEIPNSHTPESAKLLPRRLDAISSIRMSGCCLVVGVIDDLDGFAPFFAQ